MTNRELAEREFALIVSAGAEQSLDALFGDHHLAFERIWALARADGFTKEDIEHLGWAADLRDKVGVRDAGWTATALRDLADRIADRLPPEER